MKQWSWSRSPRFRSVLAVAVLGVVLVALAGAAVPAQDADALAKDADQALRNAQRQMFSGKLEAAKTHLEAAAKLIEKLKAEDSGHRRLKSLESKYARQSRDLERRLARGAPKKGPAGSGAPAKAGEKLPGGVTHRLKKIDGVAKNCARLLASKGKSEEWKAKQYAYQLESAVTLMAEIRKSYGDKIPAGHPEVKAREVAIARMQAELAALKKAAGAAAANAAEAKAQCEAQSAEWLAKLRPYTAGPANPGHDKTRYLIAGGTSDLNELERRKKIHDQAAAVFATYRKTAFPAGKTTELELVEKDLAYALETFAKGYQESLASFLGEAEKKVAHAAGWLKTQEAKDDGKKKPLTLQKDIIPDLKKMIAIAATTVAKNDPKVAALHRQLADVEKRNAKLHQLRKERTFLMPDRFKGGELAEIKARAAEFLKQKHPEAAVLRTTVISADWKEERVVEHTDTTKTAVRYRVTRSVSAQIAGKEGDEVFLFTLHVAKDRRTDGTFGPLHGHVMFIDPMLEKNVKK